MPKRDLREIYFKNNLHNTGTRMRVRAYVSIRMAAAKAMEVILIVIV